MASPSRKAVVRGVNSSMRGSGDLKAEASSAKAVIPCDSNRPLMQDTDELDEHRASGSNSGGWARASLRAVPVALLLVAAVHWAVSARSPAGADVGAVTSSVLIQPNTEIPVTTSCTVFKGHGDWTPLGTVNAGQQVIATGPAHQQDSHELVPVKVIIPNQPQILEGEVQTKCLELPEAPKKLPAAPLPVAPNPEAPKSPPAASSMPDAPPPAKEDEHDCETDKDQFRTHWARERQMYCCASVGVGCPTHAAPTGATTAMPSVTQKPRPAVASMPEIPAPPPVATACKPCANVEYSEGYKLCRETYCGNEDANTVNVENWASCRKLCNDDPNCVAYEVFGRDSKQCTMRPSCNNPVCSSIGTSVAFKTLRQDPQPEAQTTSLWAPMPAPQPVHVEQPQPSSMRPILPTQQPASMPPVVPQPQPLPSSMHPTVPQQPGSMPPVIEQPESMPPVVPQPQPLPSSMHPTVPQQPGSMPPVVPQQPGSMPPVIEQPESMPPDHIVPGVLAPQPIHCPNQAVGILANVKFDCTAGYDNWAIGWSVEKAQWCCHVCNVACELPSSTSAFPKIWPGDEPCDTKVVTTTTQTTTVSSVVVVFDCGAGLENAYKGWSVWKKRWCCTNEKKGCGIQGAVAGSFHLDHVCYEKLPTEPLLEKQVFQTVKEEIKKLANDGEKQGIEMKDITIEYWETVSPDGGCGGVAVRFAISPRGKVSQQDIRDRLTCTELKKKVPDALQYLDNIEKVSDDWEKIDLTKCEIELSTHKLECVCSHGSPVSSENCPGDGENTCQSCEFGYTHTGADDCDANRCTCSNGVAAVGAGCPESGEEACGFCVQGFHLEEQDGKRFVCVVNECECEHGSPAGGSACQMHKSDTCSKCDMGYHVEEESHSCDPNHCFCNNGVAAEDAEKECDKHQSEVCMRCDAGFHRDPAKKTCEHNVCTCEKGEPAVGAACHTNDQQVCATCDAAAFLTSENICGFKTCDCPHGQAVNQALCTTNRGIICQSCDPRYRLIGGQCVPDVCHCEGGTPSQNCTEAKPCSSCKDGYHMLNGKCRGNTCICSHGEPAKGETCLEDGLEVCATCRPGYHAKLLWDEEKQRNKALCNLNICKCGSGAAATLTSNPSCHSNDHEICSSCEHGYYLGKDHVCRMKHCTCANGRETKYLDCPQQAMDDCEECLDGYFLSDHGSKLKIGKVCRPDWETKAPFDCTAGFEKRLLGWSELKKDWCCRNKNVACRIANASSDDACSVQFTERECSLISCCEYTTNKGCHGKYGKKACIARRTVQLNGTGFCLTPTFHTNRDRTAIVQSCNGQELKDQHGKSTNKQYWTWDGTSDQLKNEYMDQCLEVQPLNPHEQNVWPVFIKPCTVDIKQKWTLDSIRNGRFWLNSPFPPIKKLCLAVRKGDLLLPGAEVIARPCEDKDQKVEDRTTGENWIVPKNVDGSSNVLVNLPDGWGSPR